MKVNIIVKKILKIITIILMILVITLLSLLVHHFITRKRVEQYLPGDAQAYVAIDSLKELYDDIIDLKALEIVFTQENLNDLFYSVIDFKNAEFSKSFLFREILKLKAYIVLQENYSPSIIIDPGVKGIVTRHIPFALSKIKNEDIQVTTSLLDKEALYTITVKDEISYHIIIQENLILLSLEREDLQNLLKANRSGEGLKTRDKLKELKSSKVKDSILNLFLDTNRALQNISEEGSPTKKLLSLVEFPSLTSLSMALTNDSINLKATTDIATEEPLIKNFLGHKAAPIGVIKTLPDSTNIYTSVNFKSFEELYSIFSLLQDDIVLQEYDILLQALSGLNSDDILFSWTGSEAGLFTIDTAPEPVIFIEISKEKELNRILQSLDSSLILNVSDSLIIDDIRINQFKLPKLIEAGMSIVNKSSSLPYFIQHEEYLFLSMNPETLAQVLIKERQGELLIKEKTYKSITQKTPKNANFFFYYDLNSTLPRFLAKDNIFSNLIREYEKGVISLFYTENKIRLNLSAETGKSKKTTLFPGYPKKTEGILSPVYVKDITGKESQELIYINSKNNLVISDISNKELSSTTVGNDSHITFIPNREILINDSDGIFYRINGEGEIIEPTPVFTEAKNSFPPLKINKDILVYSALDKEMQLYNYKGDLKNSFPVKKDVFSTPLLMDGNLYFYPKSLFGNVMCTDLNGNNIKGWPQQTMAISFTTPFRAGENIGFLTQKGDLFLWDKKGNTINGFPLSLEGVFYTTPVSLNDKGTSFAVINKDGELNIVNSKGKITQTRSFQDIKGKDIKLMVNKIPGFKNPVLFIYGGSNYITALNSKLQLLPGFPVKGYTEPTFTDINKDGFIELISAGYDKNLYIYTIRSN